MAKITVQQTEVTIVTFHEQDFISLTNMENLNAVFINENMPQRDRLIKLNQIAIHQMKVLQEVGKRKFLK